MPTLTQNLFYGTDEDHFDLDVSGDWPGDIDGWLFNVGPDRRRPGGHWFLGQGLLCRVACKPDASGRIGVDLRRVETPLDRIRRATPEMFRRLGVQEVSPFGFSNFANTNVQAMGERLFLGYDVGRPIEVDPETLEYLTPVGANSEWLMSLPAPVEPMIAVAAHPGSDWDTGELYFANYELIPLSGERGFRICRFDGEGELRHWSLTGIGAFDSVHDVKVTRSFVVISDLPFVTEPFGPDPNSPRRAVAHRARIWIVKKADLESTPAGAAVPFATLDIPMMAGHMAVDYADDGRTLVLHVSHNPLTDLVMALIPGDVRHGTNEPIPADYEGLIPIGQQPSGMGRYVIDVEQAKIVDDRVTADTERFWGGALFTTNQSTDTARAQPANLWMTGIGYDPELVSERWWRVYAEEHEGVFVAPRDFPKEAVPGALARFDLQETRIAEIYSYTGGAFPHPPTFVPRIGCRHDADGYIVTFVHRDGDKGIDVFDAANIAAGPIAHATAPGFVLPLLLHTWWMPRRLGARPSSYAIDPDRDAWETLRAFSEDPSAGVAIARSIYERAG